MKNSILKYEVTPISLEYFKQRSFEIILLRRKIVERNNANPQLQLQRRAEKPKITMPETPERFNEII